MFGGVSMSCLVAARPRIVAPLALAICINIPLFARCEASPFQESAATSQPLGATPAPAASDGSPLTELDTLIAAGKFESAQQKLDALRAQSPQLAGIDREQGMLDYQRGDMAKADAAFQKAVTQDPTDKVAIQMRGMTLFRTGRPAEAIPLLEKANGWLPAFNSDANYILGLCYMQTRRYEDARKAFATMLRFPPESPEAYLLTARLLFRYEFVPVAQQMARKALELKPVLPLAHQLLGEIALSQQNFPEAQAELEKERDINPMNPAVYDRLGDAYSREQKYEDAQKALNRAILLDPYASGPVILLGKVMLKQGDAAMASNFLARAVHMDPNNYMAHNLLGQAYRALGRPEDAAREIQTATRLQNITPETKANQ